MSKHLSTNINQVTNNRKGTWPKFKIIEKKFVLCRNITVIKWEILNCGHVVEY